MADIDFDIQTIDINDLLSNVSENVKKHTYSFEDILNMDGSLKREVYVVDIIDGVGSSVDGHIRFWNEYDNKYNISVEERKPIKIYIDSFGGSLSDTFTIIDSIKLSKTPIITICTGCAYSGGFFIFISGHKRVAYPHASFLFHEGSTSNGGTSGQFENYTVFYKRQLEQLKKIVLENTSIAEDEYKTIRKDDIWYSVKDGVKKGFIDEIAEEFV